METKRNHIDELFKKSLEGFAPEPSPQVWKGISRKLSWKEFVRFDFTNFSANLFQIAAAGIAAVTIVGVVVSQLWTTNPETIPIPPATIETAEVPAAVLPDDSSTYQVITGGERQPANEIMEAGVEKVQDAPAELAVNVITEISPGIIPVEQPGIGVRQKDLIGRALARPVALFTLPIGELSHAGIDTHSLAPKLSLGPYGDEAPKVRDYRLALSAGYWLENMTLGEGEAKNSFWYNSADFMFRFEKPDFYIQAGLGYTRVFDRTYYNVAYKTYDSVNFYYNVHYYVPDPNNPSSVILITSRETLFDSVLHTRTDYISGSYDFIQLPVSAGYKFLRFNDFSVSVFGGAVLQYNVRKEEPQPEYLGYFKKSVKADEITVTRNDFVWMLYGGLKAQWFWKERWAVEFEPAYRRYMNPLTEAGKSPYSIGLRAGVSYYF